MCARNHHRRSNLDFQDVDKTALRRERFNKKVRTFLMVNSVFLFIAISGRGAGDFLYITLFWGLSLYFQHKALDSGKKPCFARSYKQDRGQDLVDDQSIKDQQPNWKDRDLV